MYQKSGTSHDSPCKVKPKDLGHIYYNTEYFDPYTGGNCSKYLFLYDTRITEMKILLIRIYQL